MRRYIFYLLIALLAFGIGSFVVFKFYIKPVEKKLIVQKIETIESNSKIKTENHETKYSCKERELVSFWEKLDEKAFLTFQKTLLKQQNKGYPKLFQKEWKKLSKNFNCSYFGGINKEIDLNSDGKNELFVLGQIVSNHADGETFVFQNKNGKYKVILYDGGSIEDKIGDTKTKDYFDIVFKTNWAGGGQTISHYKYKGKTYKAVKCFSEDEEIMKNGELIHFEKPVISPTACNPLNNLAGY